MNLEQTVTTLFSLIPPGKEPVAEALVGLSDLSFSQRRYLYSVLKRYEFTLKTMGITLPAQPTEAAIELPSEPYFIDYLKNVFILKLSDNQAQSINMVPRCRYDRKTGLYSVPYRLLPVLELHKFVKKTGLYYTEAAKQAILGMYTEMRERYRASIAHDAEIDMGSFGLALDPFQRAGIKGAARFKRGWIADEMGLGKTRQALGVLWQTNARPTFITCPASIPINWEQEATEGLIDWRIWRARNTKAPVHTCTTKQLSLLQQSEFDDSCDACCFAQADIIIANHDKLASGWKVQFDEQGRKIKGKKREKGERAEVQLSPLAEAIKNRGLRGIILDESQACKNEAAQRTKAVTELAAGCEIRLALSGTPVKSRPSELVAQAKILDRLDDLGGEDIFYRRFCGATAGNTKGNSNEIELNRTLRAIGFIQRNKRDVRKELPPIREGVIWVEIDNREEYERVEENVVEWCAEQAVLKEEFQRMLKELDPMDASDAIERKMIETRMRVMRAAAMIKIGALKRVAAKGKIRAIVDWCKTFLASEKKLVLFAHHKFIQNAIREEFNALHISGSDDIGSRQAHKEIFQGERGNFTGLNSQLIVISSAAREGVNLDAADDIGLAEPQWTPTDEMQIIARVDRHRVHNINAYRFVAKDTIEITINELLRSKRKIVDAVTKGERGPATEAELHIFDELFAELSGLSPHKISGEVAKNKAIALLRSEPPEPALSEEDKGEESFLEAAL